MVALSALDLNLLISLDHLLEARSVSGAARRAGTSQPSMSRTLSRLREVFGDRILITTGRGMSLTERGRELVPRVREALASIDRVLAPQEPFEPARDRSVFRLAASDLATLTIVRPMMAALRRDAPGLELRVVPATPGSIDEIVRGDVDLAIAPRVALEGVEQLVFRPLNRDRYVCVVRPDHAVAKRKLTLERYLGLEHVVISRGTPAASPVAETLHGLGEARRVVLTVPSFLEAIAIVAATDLAAALPERLVRAAGIPLCARPLPFAVKELALHLVFHPRLANDRRHRWLRERLSASAQD